MDKKKSVEWSIKDAMLNLGLDMEDASIKDTPARVAKMWVDEIFSGLNEAPPKMTTFVSDSDAMVTQIGITVRSTCEHHLQPIYGRAHVAYIPNGKVLGLSKFNRVVDYFARRPQIQERLTSQISEYLKAHLDTDDVAVIIDAEHFCVKMRGIKDDNPITRTTCLSGKFKEKPDVRQEFFAAIPKVDFYG